MGEQNGCTKIKIKDLDDTYRSLAIQHIRAGMKSVDSVRDIESLRYYVEDPDAFVEAYGKIIEKQIKLYEISRNLFLIGISLCIFAVIGTLAIIYGVLLNQYLFSTSGIAIIFVVIITSSAMVRFNVR